MICPIDPGSVCPMADLVTPIPSAAARPAGINYERLYDVPVPRCRSGGRQAVWREIASYVHGRMDAPQRVLDPAAGRGEFITAVPAAERWGVDLVSQGDIEAAGRAR